jgi:hypothetical protein
VARREENLLVDAKGFSRKAVKVVYIDILNIAKICSEVIFCIFTAPP